MADEELEKALVSLVGAVRRVWEEAHVAPDVPIGQVVYVREGMLIDFPNSPEQVEYERLVRIIYNASKAADRLLTYAQGQGGSAISGPVVTRSAAMAYAVRLRDSLKTLVELLGGEEMVDKLTPDWMPPPSVGIVVGDTEDTLTIYHEPGCEKIAVRLGEVYQKVKEVRDKASDGFNVQNELDAILALIRKGEST